MGIEDLEFYYFKNFLVVVLYCFHTFYLKLECYSKVDLNSKETNLPLWFLFISESIRGKFIKFYQDKGYHNNNELDYFQWFVKAVRFHNECASHSKGSLVICKFYSIVPRLCMESKYIFQEIRRQPHRKLVVRAVILLKELKSSKILDLKTHPQLTSLNAALTIALTSLTNENFIQSYYNKFTDLVQPFLMEVAVRLQLIVDKFRETNSGRKSLYQLSFWRNHLNSSDLILHPPNTLIGAKAFSHTLFEGSSNSEKSQEFENYSTLEIIQDKENELAERRSKQKKDRKIFRRQANGKLGREKRCIISIQKASTRHRWNVTKRSLHPWLWSALKLGERTKKEGMAACKIPGTKALTLIYSFLNKEIPVIV